eukprot:CAMPEP_0172833272 /NCGR_PEP_ID=MMETSP1075-20121228/24254_1 /TAXON_ID=2916 /ORGANISM="Ceratium fusus, Strain PA161109" /LENGTH=121 /DNA_ID=CAMNT_0013675997 /DNA_START=1124 /DNA_END=1490 /DNA_ORIENTATION=+
MANAALPCAVWKWALCSGAATIGAATKVATTAADVQSAGHGLSLPHFFICGAPLGLPPCLPGPDEAPGRPIVLRIAVPPMSTQTRPASAMTTLLRPGFAKYCRAFRSAPKTEGEASPSSSE